MIWHLVSKCCAVTVTARAELDQIPRIGKDPVDMSRIFRWFSRHDHKRPGFADTLQFSSLVPPTKPLILIVCNPSPCRGNINHTCTVINSLK